MKQLTISFVLIILFSKLTYSQDYTPYLSLDYSEIDSLMMVYYGNRAFDKVIPLMQAGKEKAEKEFGQQDSIVAEYTSNLGFFYLQTGKYDKALAPLLEAKDIREKVLGKLHPDFAIALNNLAVLYYNMGNFDKALSYYIEAKDIREKALGNLDPSFAMSLNNLAALYQRLGKYDKALPLFFQAKNIQEKTLGKMHPDFANSLNNLAYLHRSMGNYDEALPLFIQAKNIQEKTLGKMHPDFANSLSNLATVHRKMGNYEKALPLLIQAVNIQKKALGKMHPNFTSYLNELAGLYKSMNNYEKALMLYKQAIHIQEKNFGESHPSFITFWANLALLHQEMGNYDEALPLYKQAIHIQEKTFGKRHPKFATSLNNLASLYQKMSKYDEALPLYIQAIDIQENVLGKTHPDLPLSLNNLALLYQKMGNYNKAWKTALLSIQASSNTRLSMAISPLWADTLLNASFASNLHLERAIRPLGTIFTLLQKDSTIYNPSEKQIILTDLAAALLTKLRHNVSNDKDKLRMLSTSSQWLQKSLECLQNPEHNNKAFAFVDQNKSVLLLQASKSEQAYRLGNLPDSLVLLDKKNIKKQSRLQAKLVENRPNEEKDSLRNELNQVNQDIGAFLQMIKSKYPKYHELKYQQVDAQAADIQELLDDQTALVEYVIGDSVVHIFCVDKKQVQWKKSFVKNKILSTRIKKLHQALSNYKALLADKNLAYRNYTKQAHWFYSTLLAPVLADQPQIKHLIVVTDGALGHLPFETFLVKKASEQVIDYHQLHYLVNDYNISYNYSATLWKENVASPAPQNNGQILGLAANYEIQLDSSMKEVRLPTDQWLRKTLLPLPEARKEVKTLQEKYQGFFAFDTLASEKTLKEKVSNFAILHFATHGILDAKRPMLSSLALTEDNDSLESNFWQAHEISKIQLNANLVVLSACETGFGKFEKGNGIASLARAFMYAGASSLIVSLWQVNDQATSIIMTNLYENLAKGMKIDNALRQAKIQYMKIAEGLAAHPAFWSPFIQMGNTQPVAIKTKGEETLPWMIGGAVLLLLLGGFALFRRKKEVV